MMRCNLLQFPQHIDNAFLILFYKGFLGLSSFLLESESEVFPITPDEE